MPHICTVNIKLRPISSAQVEKKKLETISRVSLKGKDDSDSGCMQIFIFSQSPGNQQTFLFLLFISGFHRAFKIVGDEKRARVALFQPVLSN